MPDGRIWVRQLRYHCLKLLLSVDSIDGSKIVKILLLYSISISFVDNNNAIILIGLFEFISHTFLQINISPF